MDQELKEKRNQAVNRFLVALKSTYSITNCSGTKHQNILQSKCN